MTFASYLDLTSFHDGLNPNELTEREIDELFDRYKKKTYLPLLNFPATGIKEDIRIRESLLDFLSQSIEHKLQLSPQIRAAISYLIDETVNNIKDHARTERGYLLTQFYPKKEFMDLCIADMGISLLGSYHAVGRIEISSHEQALQSALNGESTKADPNRGFGIRTSRQMLVQGLGGSYFVMSGNAFFYDLPGKAESIGVFPKEPGIQWNGTYIALRIPVQRPDFQISRYLE